MTRLPLSRYKLSPLAFSSLSSQTNSLLWWLPLPSGPSSVPVSRLCVLPSTAWSRPPLGRSSSPTRPVWTWLPPTQHETAGGSPAHKNDASFYSEICHGQVKRSFIPNDFPNPFNMSTNGIIREEIAFFPPNLVMTFTSQLTPQRCPVQPQSSTSSSQSKLQKQFKAKTSSGLNLVCLFLRLRPNHDYPADGVDSCVSAVEGWVLVLRQWVELCESFLSKYNNYNPNIIPIDFLLKVMWQQQPIPAGTGREAGIHPGKVTSLSQDARNMTWTVYFKFKTRRAEIGDSSHVLI